LPSALTSETVAHHLKCQVLAGIVLDALLDNTLRGLFNQRKAPAQPGKKETSPAIAGDVGGFRT
jgi:hypothetical protein